MHLGDQLIEKRKRSLFVALLPAGSARFLLCEAQDTKTFQSTLNSRPEIELDSFVQVLVGNDRRNSNPDSTPAPTGPPVTLTMSSEDVVKALEALENRLYRCLLIANAPLDDGGDTAGRDAKTPR